MVYVQAHNVMTRDQGIRMFERFAVALSDPSREEPGPYRTALERIAGNNLIRCAEVVNIARAALACERCGGSGEVGDTALGTSLSDKRFSCPDCNGTGRKPSSDTDDGVLAFLKSEEARIVIWDRLLATQDARPIERAKEIHRALVAALEERGQ